MAEAQSSATSNEPPPRLVMLIGPPAVGKMTVGQELAALTGWPLIFNHRVIDLVTPYFPYGTDASNRLIRGFFGAFFREAAAAGFSLVSTFGWRFDSKVEVDLMQSYIEPYLTAPDAVFFAELTAPLDVRLARNRTENRRLHKNVEWATEEELTSLHNAHRWNSDGDFPFDLPHIVLDNSNLEPRETALAIASRFNLPVLP